jgi:hypothetical protein
VNPDPRARSHALDSLDRPSPVDVVAWLYSRAPTHLEPVPSPGLAAPHRNATIMTIDIQRIAFASIFVLSALPQLGCDGADEGGDEANDETSETETGETGETETGETETETGGGDMLEIAGDYLDEWGDMHTITSSSWTNSAGTFHLEIWDNAADYAGAHNDETNMYSPGLYSRFDWHYEGTTLYYCQTAFDAASLSDALAANADRSDLAAGCGGFAWTNLTP